MWCSKITADEFQELPAYLPNLRLICCHDSFCSRFEPVGRRLFDKRGCVRPEKQVR
jgi:hypothetical protein